jgi:hypothetical protein
MFTVSNEKINIFEALAQAGDLSIYGVRDRVKLIRENDRGRKEIHTINLNDANIINSPYYYLQQNDVVYVEPNSVKAKNSAIGTSTTIWISVTGALVSLASLVVNILRRYGPGASPSSPSSQGQCDPFQGAEPSCDRVSQAFREVSEDRRCSPCPCHDRSCRVSLYLRLIIAQKVKIIYNFCLMSRKTTQPWNYD